VTICCTFIVPNTNGKGRTDKYSKKHAFSSMIKCGFCGSTAIRRTWHSGTKHEKNIWMCVKFVKEGKKSCPDCKALDEKLKLRTSINSMHLENSIIGVI